METTMRILPRKLSNASLLCAALAAPTLIAALLTAALTIAQLSAQTPAPSAHTAAGTHTASATHSAAATRAGAATHAGAATADASHIPGGCITLPADISPKIPAVPSGSPCPKALFTVTVAPPATVTYVSPLEPDIAKILGLEPNSFTLGYIDTRIGTGAPAAPQKYYTVKYTGYLPDGTVFDSSYKHDETADGLSFQVGAHRVIPGWDNGFAGMHVGGKRRLFIPYPLAYGAQGQPPTIPAHTDLIFDMELVSQSDEAPAPKTPSAGQIQPGSVQGGVGNAPRVVRAVPENAPATPPADRLLPPAATAPAAPATAQPATPPATESK
jgi:peptidylprolyl isomerase